MAGGSLRSRACRTETSITAVSMFEAIRMPLPTSFFSISFVTSQKSRMCALGLQRALGVRSYETSWICLLKLRRAKVRPGRYHLAGSPEADETYLSSPVEVKPVRPVEIRPSSRYRYRHGQGLAFTAGGPFSDLFDTIIGAEVAERLG